MRIFKNCLWVALGVLIAVVGFCAVVGIASAVNGIAFGEQIVQWFGTVKEVVDSGLEQAPEVTAMLKI